MRVAFVRVLRMEGMKFGYAVDASGKRWQGFHANKSDEAIRQSALLGDVGICCVCHERVRDGWECMSARGKDVCPNCAKMPPTEKCHFVGMVNQEEWTTLLKEFWKNESFNCQWRHKS